MCTIGQGEFFLRTSLFPENRKTMTKQICYFWGENKIIQIVSQALNKGAV